MTKLLVVDDEPSVRKLIKRFFEARGFEVYVAENGMQGWSTTRDSNPDLVLTDVSMPDMDGYELTRTIRRNPATASIPIILLSAHRQADAMVQGYESGADDYVAKPVDMEVLRHKIDALIRRSATAGGEMRQATGKLICVTAAKGGVGTTTLVANLSVLLCRRNETVCALDLNLEHGDLPVMFDLTPKSSMSEAVRDLATLGDNFQWDDYLARHASGPRILAAPFKPHEASGLDDGVVTSITNRLRQLHDYVVADLPPSYSDNAISTYENAERIVVVTSPEITSLRRTRELLAVLQTLGIPDERVLVVLNRIIDVAGIDARRTESFLRRPVAATIPNGNGAFVEAVTSGRPMVLSHGNSPSGEAIIELAGML